MRKKRHDVVVCVMDQTKLNAGHWHTTVVLRTQFPCLAILVALSLALRRKSNIACYEVAYRRASRLARRHFQTLAELSGGNL